MKKLLIVLSLFASSAWGVVIPSQREVPESSAVPVIIPGSTGFTIVQGVSDQGGPTLLCPPEVQRTRRWLEVSGSVCRLQLSLNEAVNYTAVTPQKYLDDAFAPDKYEVVGISPIFIRNEMRAVIYYRLKTATD